MVEQPLKAAQIWMNSPNVSNVFGRPEPQSPGGVAAICQRVERALWAGMGQRRGAQRQHSFNNIN